MNQNIFLALAAVYLLVPCLALTEDEAKAIINENKGRYIGLAKAQTAVLVKASYASASNPLQRNCIGSKTKLAMVKSVVKVKEAAEEISKYATENWETLSKSDASEIDQIMQGEYKNVVSSIVKENEASLKQCLA